MTKAQLKMLWNSLTLTRYLLLKTGQGDRYRNAELQVINRRLSEVERRIHNYDLEPYQGLKSVNRAIKANP